MESPEQPADDEPFVNRLESDEGSDGEEDTNGDQTSDIATRNTTTVADNSDDDDDDDEAITKKQVIDSNLLDDDDDDDDKSEQNEKEDTGRKRKANSLDNDDEEEEEGDKVNDNDDDGAGSGSDTSAKKKVDKAKISKKKAKVPPKKKAKVSSKKKSSDDDDDEDSGDNSDSDSGSSSDGDEDDELSADKDNDDEEEKGDNENDDEDDDDDEGRGRRKTANDTIYDFDIMMAKKKEENSRRRRRRGYDIINDNDDIIADIINQMKDAVEADIEANRNKQVATNKLKLLPFLINQLRKVDLRDAFLDSDVLSVMTEWLAPLPDRSLPHLNIRENLLKILIDFNLYDVDRIKSSGIGKAIMYLYKHPKETKENKQRAKQLISAWSRPIFNLDSSFSAISREEREERDKELQRRASRVVNSSDNEGSSQTPKKVQETNQPVAKNPGDKGWIPRARVPAPSMRDYVIRPRSKVDGDIGKGSKRPANMLEKLMKTHQERRRANKQQRAVNMKIDKL